MNGDTIQAPRRYPTEFVKVGPRSDFIHGYQVAAGGLLSGVFTHELLRKNYPETAIVDETEFGLGVIEALQDWEKDHALHA